MVYIVVAYHRKVGTDEGAVDTRESDDEWCRRDEHLTRIIQKKDDDDDDDNRRQRRRRQ